jgi:Na+/H+-dicarboxylate symporter
MKVVDALLAVSTCTLNGNPESINNHIQFSESEWLARLVGPLFAFRETRGTKVVDAVLAVFTCTLNGNPESINNHIQFSESIESEWLARLVGSVFVEF